MHCTVAAAVAAAPVPAVCATAVLPDAGTRTEPTAAEAVETERPWNVVVWDDPVNLMSYVTWVFRSYFGYPQEKARRLMLEVHHSGRSVVASGSLEEAETHTAALHGFGLWATFEQAGGK